jgi:hydrogenase maturation protease
MSREPTTGISTIAATGSVCPSCMVIGCGNPLRGDDRLGPAVAQIVETWRLPGVAAIAVHQLTPEIAATLAQYDRAIFVDARHIATTDAAAGAAVRVETLRPALHPAPEHVLALAQTLYGHCPQTWLVSIPAQCFDFGAPLSAAAQRGQTVALLAVRYLVRSQQGYAGQPCC